MEWLRRLFGERYDPEKDERVQELLRAAERERERKEAAQRRTWASERMAPPRDRQGEVDGTRS